MVHALATQRRVRRNRPRWRKTASGRQHYNYFRDYDPSTGRYVQSDPIGLAGGLSTFAYVRSSPYSRIDPMGLVDMKFTGPNEPANIRVGLDYIHSRPGELTVGIHYDGENFQYDGKLLSPSDLADEIRARAKTEGFDLDSYDVLTLYSCRTAVADEGKISAAQALARALKIDVYGADEFIWTYNDETAPFQGIHPKDILGNIDRTRRGSWVRFDWEN